MACKKCGSCNRCSCFLEAGDGTVVTGTGSKTDPWIVSTGGGPAAFACSDLTTCSVNDLGDVNTAGADVGELLTWNGVAWVPAAAGAGFTCAQLAACTIGNLGNVDETGAVAGNFLGFNGAQWVPVSPPGGSGFVCSDLNLCPIDSLADVDTTGADPGEVLTFNGVAWVPVSPPAAPTCEAIQDCVGGGFDDGLVYDDAANQFRARLSTDPGNATIFGTDGGLFTPGGGGGEACADDTEFFDVAVLCSPSVGMVGIITERACATGVYSEPGWIDLSTGVFTAGPPPDDTTACDAFAGSMAAHVAREAPLPVSGAGTPIAIAWDTEIVDTGPTAPGLWDPAFPTRITAQAAGWWTFDGSLEVTGTLADAEATVEQELFFRRNGVADDVWWADTKLAHADVLDLLPHSMTTGGAIFLNEGDFIELMFLPFLGLVAETTNARNNCRLVARYTPT